MKIQVTKKGFINYLKDGKLKSYAPNSFDVNDPPENIPQEVVGLAKETWTEEVVQAWENYNSVDHHIEQWRQTASLSRRRFKIGEALYKHNGTPLVELIEEELTGLPEPTKTIAVKSYEESGSFDRLDPFIVQFSQALGMSDEEVDEFFQYCLQEGWND